MNLTAKPFVLLATLAGASVETRDCDSIAEAEVWFGELVGQGRVDCGEIYAADRFDRPVRVLRVR